MNHLFTLLASLLLRLSFSTGPQAAAANFSGREMPAPTVDLLERAAASRTAYLTDVLRLSYAQARQVRRCTYDELRALQWRSDSVAVGGRPNDADDVNVRYHRQLTRVLTCAQYATLLRLETVPAAPLFATR